MTDDTDERGEEYVARQRGGDHLPECTGVDPDWASWCICDRLRACAARVLDKADGYTEGYADGYVKGQQHERQRSVLLIADAYGKALDAAREAIGNTRFMSMDDALRALAAIDALRPRDGGDK